MNLGPVLVIPAAALRTTAAALRLAAATGQRLADILSPDRPETAPTAPQPAPPPRRTAPAAPSAATPPLPPSVDRRGLDMAALAARPAPEVVAALDALGTADLADLYEHESTHRRRRTVMDAITAAAAPPATDTAEDLELLDDVRTPDEVVYSTQTPRG